MPSPHRSATDAVYVRCGRECESTYRCSCGECQENCVCALGHEQARCPYAPEADTEKV